MFLGEIGFKSLLNTLNKQAINIFASPKLINTALHMMSTLVKTSSNSP